MRRPKHTGIRCCTLRCLKNGPVDFLELVMAHYYLGDKEGRGLAIVLDDLRREQEVAFGQLFLAGLGWALRSDRTAAHSNFRLAVMRSKSTASGRLLPRFWWAFCADLLPAPRTTSTPAISTPA
jgi:hypothetical protein